MDCMEMPKMKRMAQAKSDLVGAIHNSEVYELLGFHMFKTAGEKESWDAFKEAWQGMRLSISGTMWRAGSRILGTRGRKQASGLGSTRPCGYAWKA